MTNDKIRGSIIKAIEHLSSHPDDARYVDSPATAVMEGGLRCRVDGPDGRLAVTDMPGSIGGGGSAPSSGWLARAAQASCHATVIVMRAAQEGINLKVLEVTVDSESDDRGLLGMDDSIPAGPLSARVRIRIAADNNVNPERLRELVEWADRHSPVSDGVRRAIPTKVEVEVASPAPSP